MAGPRLSVSSHPNTPRLRLCTRSSLLIFWASVVFAIGLFRIALSWSSSNKLAPWEDDPPQLRRPLLPPVHPHPIQMAPVVVKQRPPLAATLAVLEDELWIPTQAGPGVVKAGVSAEPALPHHSPLPGLAHLLYNIGDICEKQGLSRLGGRTMEREKKGGEVGDKCMGVGSRRVRPCPNNHVQKVFHDPGFLAGGPTGCREAWATVLADVSFLPGVLVLIHSVRKFAHEPRDFLVLVAPDLPRPILRMLECLCVVVRYADTGYTQQARELRKESKRYSSGYWVAKMFLWRTHEYAKILYLDSDIFIQRNPDPLFCIEVSEVRPLAAAPRSAKRLSAGFNAGTLLLQPSQPLFDSLMTKFGRLPLRDLLATTEQEFLNAAFAGRFILFPADAIQKHRRWVNEEAQWNIARTIGFHMNGYPKPWEPQWLVPCAYPKQHQRKAHLYARFFHRWWDLYYDMADLATPSEEQEYRLLSEHDFLGTWEKWDEEEFIARCKGTVALALDARRKQ